MIDAERLLGSLVREAMGGSGGRRRGRRRRSSGMSMVNRGALGLGALGVAIAAYEHFTQQQGAKPAATAPSPGAGPPPPPPPPPGAPAAGGGVTPPLPPLPPVPGSEAASGEQQEAVLLIRAMIAAANADYELDDDERRRILEALEESGVEGEERRFLEEEMEHPWELSKLVAAVPTPELARQVYLASLMAIEVDSKAEENYLARLAERLQLAPSDVEELEALLDEEE